MKQKVRTSVIKVSKTGEKICPAPSTWMDGVYRVVRWVMRGFDAADSERTVRRESPTSPPSTSLHSHANKNSGKGGKGKENTTYNTERGVNHDQAASGKRTSHWGDCAKNLADTCYTASGPRAGFLTDKAQHKRKVNEWATECATHIFPSKNRNSRTLKVLVWIGVLSCSCGVGGFVSHLGYPRNPVSDGAGVPRVWTRTHQHAPFRQDDGDIRAATLCGWCCHGRHVVSES